MPFFDRIPAQLPRIGSCPLAFIDEAPGDDELSAGFPIAGPKGKLFRRICGQAGVDPEDCLITYLFDRELPGKAFKDACTKESPWPYEGAPYLKGAGYLPLDYLAQIQRLGSEIQAAQPQVIVPLGVTALWAVATTQKFTETRGTAFRTNTPWGAYLIVPTFRPGALFAQYKMRGTMVADIKKALSVAQSGTLQSHPRELWLNPTLTDLEAYFPRLVASSLLSVDIETERGQITKIGFASSMSSAIVVPFVTPGEPSHSYWATIDEEEAAWNWCARVGALPNPKLFQNGGYDNTYLIEHGIYLRNWCHDLRLLHHALYPELPKSLVYMMSVYGFERPWKLWSGRAQKEEKRDA